MTRMEDLLRVRNCYRRCGTPVQVLLQWKDGRKAPIRNPQAVRAVMDTVMAELDRQIDGEERKEGQA